MRFYLKLLVMTAIFLAASWRGSASTTSELAYDLRVAFVCAFGTAHDYQTLLDDTQHALAREGGSVPLYLFGKRYKELLAERLAAAARQNLVLSEEDLDRIQAECMTDAMGESDSASPNVSYSIIRMRNAPPRE